MQLADTHGTAAAGPRKIMSARAMRRMQLRYSQRVVARQMMFLGGLTVVRFCLGPHLRLR